MTGGSRSSRIWIYDAPPLSLSVDPALTTTCCSACTPRARRLTRRRAADGTSGRWGSRSTSRDTESRRRCQGGGMHRASRFRPASGEDLCACACAGNVGKGGPGSRPRGIKDGSGGAKGACPRRQLLRDDLTFSLTSQAVIESNTGAGSASQLPTGRRVCGSGSTSRAAASRVGDVRDDHILPIAFRILWSGRFEHVADVAPSPGP